MDDFHGPAAERETHPVRIDDVGTADVGLQLRRRNAAVLVAVHRRERVRPQPADARPRLGRDVDLIGVDDAVVVAVVHVARHVGIAAVHVAGHVLVGDERGGAGKHRAAGGVVVVAVAVDDVAHRHLESRVQLGLEPRGEVGVDRIAEDDAGGGDQEDRVPVAVACPIQIAGDRENLAHRPSCGRRRRRRCCASANVDPRVTAIRRRASSRARVMAA